MTYFSQVKKNATFYLRNKSLDDEDGPITHVSIAQNRTTLHFALARAFLYALCKVTVIHMFLCPFSYNPLAWE